MVEYMPVLDTDISQPAVPYRRLDSLQVCKTIEQLHRRISERFPLSSLAKLAAELRQIAEHTQQTMDWIARPIWLLRCLILILIAAIVFAIAALVHSIGLPQGQLGFAELIQTIEAAVNELVLLGAGIFFLSTVETRVKRTRALSALHELRSIAHIIDMHQLTKDPHRLFHRGALTLSSPQRLTISAFELGRYLDYCSELLSLTGKIAALYAETFRDPVALTAVNEVEELTTGLSRKVWQKLMMINVAETDVGYR